MICPHGYRVLTCSVCRNSASALQKAILDTNAAIAKLGGALTAGKTAAERTPAVPILSEVTEREETFRAWRGVTLVAGSTGVVLMPLNQYEDTQILSPQKMEAHCGGHAYYGDHVEGEHLAPSSGCSCGFWAVKDRANLDPTNVHCEVELWGRVVEHEAGYRAQFQRILSVRIPGDRCYGGFICEDPLTHVALAFHEGVNTARGPVAPAATGGLVPICTRHAAIYPLSATLERVMAVLGTEVKVGE